MAVAVKTISLSGKNHWPPQGRVSYERFLGWADEDNYAEWVDGELEIISPASLPHQEISTFLLRLIAQYVEDHHAGKVIPAPFQMKLSDINRGREPDILFVSQEHLAKFQKNYLDGPADLVVEIVSPESILRDRGAKYGEYEAAGVREYWIIDSDMQRTDFFVLDDQGRYQRRNPETNGTFHSIILPGFWIKVEWLWQDPLPTVRQIFQEWEKPS